MPSRRGLLATLTAVSLAGCLGDTRGRSRRRRDERKQAAGEQRLVRLVDGERGWVTDPVSGFLTILDSHDGTTFVATSDDEFGLSGETTHAVARDGTEHWRVESGDARQGVVHEETLYVPYGGYRTTALDVTTGEERWRYPVDAETRDSPAITGGMVYLPTLDGRVHAVGPDGERRWIRSTGPHLTDLHANEAGVVVTTRGTE